MKQLLLIAFTLAVCSVILYSDHPTKSAVKPIKLCRPKDFETHLYNVKTANWFNEYTYHASTCNYGCPECTYNIMRVYENNNSINYTFDLDENNNPFNFRPKWFEDQM